MHILRESIVIPCPSEDITDNLIIKGQTPFALRQNQDFGEFEQMNKQMRSSASLKRPVFLGGNEFRLRMKVGKPFGFPNPSARLLQTVLQRLF